MHENEISTHKNEISTHENESSVHENEILCMKMKTFPNNLHG